LVAVEQLRDGWLVSGRCRRARAIPVA
jgi:hypothetical protein